MLTLTVEIAEQDLATLQRYAAAHPEVGGLAGALRVAAQLLQARQDRADAAAAVGGPAPAEQGASAPAADTVAPAAHAAPAPTSPAAPASTAHPSPSAAAPWGWPSEQAAS